MHWLQTGNWVKSHYRCIYFGIVSPTTLSCNWAEFSHAIFTSLTAKTSFAKTNCSVCISRDVQQPSMTLKKPWVKITFMLKWVCAQNMNRLLNGRQPWREGVGEESIISLLLQPASTLPQIIIPGMSSRVAESGCCRACSRQCGPQVQSFCYPWCFDEWCVFVMKALKVWNMLMLSLTQYIFPHDD